MRKTLYFLSILLLLIGCANKNKFDVDVSKIETNFTITRFEQEFYTASAKDLPNLKKRFRAFFPHDIDSVWINKMNNKSEQELYKAVQEVFLDFKTEINSLTELFKHLKYYYPTFKEPKVITVISNIPLEQKVILDSNILYISLDVFLGKDNLYYSDYPNYIKQNLTKEHLIVEVAKVFATQAQINISERTFISRMIQKGKLLYTLDALLPNLNDAEKIGYTKEQLNWNIENEELIWRYFIDKKLLYSTDPKLNRRFLDNAPFSKFYLDIDSKSTERVGEWLGWQIVRSYMNKNKISLKNLLKTDNESIFKKSKYKPKRN